MTDTKAPAASTPGDTKKASSRFAYFPSIDGLRGLAVSTMLLYHLEVGWMGDGGPISLEVFFVISGFLITSLFVREYQSNDRIDLRGFWKRRFRRLAPALIAMFVLIALWAAFPDPWGPSAGQRAVLRDGGLSSMLYASNWYFIFSGQSYFEGFGSPSPFRHTWSLSMEEQFYLVIAVGVAWGFAKWHPHRRLWVFVTGGVVLGSAAWMAFLWRMGDLTASGLWPLGIDPESLPEWLRTFLNFKGSGDPTRMYFGTDTRLSSVFAGAFLAMVLERRPSRSTERRPYEIAGGVGLVGLILSFALAPKDWQFLYLGGYVLVDVLTLLVLYAATAPVENTFKAALSWPPLVKVGVLSYSLYVWHFPIFLILNEDRLPVDGLAFDAVRVAVAGAVAWISYHYLEVPIRSRGLGDGVRRVLLIGAVPLIMTTFLVITSIPREVAGDVTEEGANADINTAPDGRTVVMVVGDSMARTLGVNVSAQQVDAESGIQVRLNTLLGCGISVADFMVDGKPQRQAENCRNGDALRAEQTAAVKPALSLVLAWGWEIYDRRVPDADGNVQVVAYGSDQWNELLTAAIDQTVKTLGKHGGKVALLTMPCIDYESATPRHPTNKDPRDPGRVDAVNDVIRSYAADHAGKNLKVIELNEFLCPDGRHYRAEIDGQLVSDDGIHFTPDGARIVWNWMLPELKTTLGLP